MLDQDAIERTAHRLADAFVTRNALDGHAALGHDAPVSITDAYTIQARVREVAGIRTGGWKVGATSEAAQGLLGVDASFLGVVDPARLVPSGTEFVIDDWFTGPPAVEVEVGVRPRVAFTELPDDPMALADLVEVVPCIEVVDSRFGAVLGTPGACLIADNGVASALVVGEPLDVDAAAIRELGSLPVTLVVDGGDPVAGVASMALGHPLRALHAATRLAIGLGTPIGADEVVSTGTCTGLTPVAVGTTIVGTVGDATISASFA